MAGTSTLQDDFTFANSSKWYFSAGAAVSGGRLSLTPTVSYESVFSINTYDLTGSYALVEIIQTPNTGNGTTELYLELVAGSNKIDMLMHNNQLVFRETVSGVRSDTQTGFDPILHRWWRMREASGIIYWETSPNCASWTIQRQKVLGIPSITALSVSLVAGYYGTEPSPGTAVYDNLNIANTIFTPQTYYLSTAGQDSADGRSSSTPWQSLGRLYQQGIRAGDTVRLRGGDTFIGTIYVSDQIASSSQPTTIDSYGTGRATIYNYSNDAVSIQDCSGIIIQNLLITCNNPNYPASSGIDIYGITTAASTYIRIDNVDVSGFKNGIAIGNNAGGSYSDMRITNSALHGNSSVGLVTYGPPFNSSSPVYINSNVYIGYCTAYDNLGDPNNTTTNTGSGIVLGSVDTGTIEYCTAYGNGTLCSAPEGPAGLWTFDSTNVTIQYSSAYSNRTGGPADGDGFDLDQNVSHSTVQYNVAYDNDGAGILVYTGQNNTVHSNNTVRYNLCWGNVRRNNWYAEIKIAGKLYDTQIYNNTFIATDAGPYQPAVISMEAGLHTLAMRNNLLFASANGPLITANAPLATSDIIFQGNAYTTNNGTIINWNGSNYSSLTAWRAALNQELVNGFASGFESDAGLISYGTMPVVVDPSNINPALGLKLRPGSALATTGLDLNTRFGINPGTRDYFNTAISIPTSIGAAQAGAYDARGWVVGSTVAT